MSKASLKKALSGLEASSLMEVILELYDARKDAKEYLEYWANPDPEGELEKRKEDVTKLFFYSTGKIRKAPSATELKNHVKEFASLVFEPEKVAELLVHIAATHYSWLTQKHSGFSSAEAGARRSLENARKYIENADLEEVYGLKLERISAALDELTADPPEPRRRGRRRWW